MWNNHVFNYKRSFLQLKSWFLEGGFKQDLRARAARGEGGGRTLEGGRGRAGSEHHAKTSPVQNTTGGGGCIKVCKEGFVFPS